MTRFRRAMGACLSFGAVVAATATALSVDPTVAEADGGASVYLAVGPVRLADTRSNSGFTRPAGSTIRVAVAGRGGVPRNASAAVLTITATDNAGSGYVTVYPSGTARPATSTLNLNAPRSTVANSTIMVLGGGSVDIFTSTPAQLIVDVSGAFVPSGAAAGTGRLALLDGGAQRVVDTRSGRRPGGNSSIRVRRPASVPADAIAVAANVTITDSAGPGFWTVWPAGGPRPEASILNSDAAGQTRAALTIIPITADGLDVYGSVGAHVIVDITGYFTGAGAPAGDDGLFVPIDPTRALDTRGRGPVAAGGTIEVASVRPGKAQVFNLTTTQARTSGYVTAYPAGQARPTTSNVNSPTAGVDVANLAIIETSARGIALFSAGGEHLIVDVTGYFTGSPAPAPNPPPPPPPTTPPPPPTPPPAPSGTSGVTLDRGCTEVGLTRTNEVRAGVGSGPLAPEAALARYACAWSRHMYEIQDMVHSDMTFVVPFRNCASGENIAVSSQSNDTSLFDLWLSSPGHYRNIISKSFTHTAIVNYTGPNGGTWATMVFAGRCGG